MSIYISKNAINSNPFFYQTVNNDEQVYPPLKSRLLNDIEYLNSLNRNDLNTLFLSEANISEDVYVAVQRIKIALEIIDSYSGIAYDIPNGSFSSNSGIYDSELTAAVSAFQNFTGIETSGIVDSKTLNSIDSYLLISDKTIYDKLTNSIVGENAEKKIDIVENYNSTTNEYSYSININNNLYTYNSNLPLSTSPIVNSQNPDLNNHNFKLDQNIKDKIYLDNNIESGLFNDIEFGSIPYDKITLRVDPDLPFNYYTVQSTIETTPPQILADEHAKLHKVQPNEDFVALIIDNYYNQEQNIANPFYNPATDPIEEANIFTLPSRTPSPNSERGNDARMQFYLNLIYYYNTVEVIDEQTGDITVTEYGIRASQDYSRYDNDHLNDYNIFDNAFDNSDDDTVLPNYYRFLKTQETLGTNPTQIEFESSTGQQTSFVPDDSKYIWIPSRQFADSLYYHLNFRHSEMLTNSGSDIVYETASVLAGIIVQMQATSIWDALTTWLSNEIEELYTETLEFYKAAYNYAILKLTQHWPRGFGGNLGAGIGVTWGFPIATDVKMSKKIWRKMSKLDELTVMMREEIEVYLGIDVAVGVSAGFKMGSGKSKKTAGLALGAGAGVGIRPKLTMEYEFPVRPEETALLSVILTVFDSSQVISNVLGAMNVINLNPRQYLTRMHFGLPLEGKAWAKGELGFTSANEPLVDDEGNVTTKNVTKKNKANAAEDEAKDKSFLSADSIFSKVDGIGLQGNVGFDLGIEFEYKAKYDNNPLVPEVHGRIPSEVETQNLYFLRGYLNVGPMGSFLQRIFLNIGFGGFFALLNFDRGIAFAVNNKYIRTGLAKDITESQVNIANATGISEANGGLSYQGTNWKRNLLIGSYTGDVETMFSLGTESFIKLNAFKIYGLLQGYSDTNRYPFDTLSDILQIFYSVQYRYKMGFGYNANRRKRLAKSVYENLNSGDIGVMRDFLEIANDKQKYGIKYGADVYAGLDVEMELQLAQIYPVLRFFFKKLYLIYQYRVVAPTDENYENYLKLLEKLKKKENAINKSLTGNVVNDADRYTQVYTQLEAYLDSPNNVGGYQNELQNPTFKPQFKIYASLFKEFNTYLFDTNSVPEGNIPSDLKVDIAATVTDTPIMEDIGVIKIIRAIVTLVTDIAHVDAAVEAKVGVAFAGSIKAGLEATVRLAFSVEGALIYHSQFFENGSFIDLPPGDFYSPAFNGIKKLFETNNNNENSKREDGLRKSLTSLPR
ncbi:peptidoglycan-binding domain-containing protein [Kordia sp.]|uniref:peptidoglycan-binding domain-containing protein n=1 Tax=Kordia sp. TaxID=1965332 RepID=UPI003D2B32ED